MRSTAIIVANVPSQCQVSFTFMKVTAQLCVDRSSYGTIENDPRLGVVARTLQIRAPFGRERMPVNNVGQDICDLIISVMREIYPRRILERKTTLHFILLYNLLVLANAVISRSLLKPEAVNGYRRRLSRPFSTVCARSRSVTRSKPEPTFSGLVQVYYQFRHGG